MTKYEGLLACLNFLYMLLLRMNWFLLLPFRSQELLLLLLLGQVFQLEKILYSNNLLRFAIYFEKHLLISKINNRSVETPLIFPH